MIERARAIFTRAYERLLSREIGDGPTHVAIIQDGNRRYARESGDDASEGHRAGASTTEQVLEWCTELGIEELTLYAFSTENFDRPDEELEPLFDLIENKLREFADADRVHAEKVCIRAIGELDRLPQSVQDAVSYARRRTRGYEGFQLNIALAYGGRNELRPGGPRRDDRCRHRKAVSRGGDRRRDRTSIVPNTRAGRGSDYSDWGRRTHLEFPPLARQR